MEEGGVEEGGMEKGGGVTLEFEGFF